MEHFDLLYPTLKMNAHVLVGIGQEVIIARRAFSAPSGRDQAVVFKSLHPEDGPSAEDVPSISLKGWAYRRRKGTAMSAAALSSITASGLAELALAERAGQGDDRPGSTINPAGNRKITIGEMSLHCTGPRHVRSTGEIKNFRLGKEYLRDPLTGIYSIVGKVGNEPAHIFG